MTQFPQVGAPASGSLVIEQIFRASLERVYKAWTSPAELREWFGPSGEQLIRLEADVKIGGRFILEFSSADYPRNAIEGQYLDVEPNQRLVFSWCHILERHDKTVERSPESRVTVAFEAQGDSTKVHLVHEGVSPAGHKNVNKGWNSTLNRLVGYLDKVDSQAP